MNFTVHCDNHQINERRNRKDEVKDCDEDNNKQ